MPRNDYLKTATNVPALPSGWNWWLSYHQIDKQSTVTDRIINWTKLLIEITDSNDEVMGSHLISIQTTRIEKYPLMMDEELVTGCRAAYNSLYSDRKLNFYEALDIAPAR